MGNKSFNDLTDCQYNGADIMITCIECDRSVVVGSWLLGSLLRKRAHRRVTDFGEARRYLKCSGCGARMPHVRPTRLTR